MDANHLGHFGQHFRLRFRWEMDLQSIWLIHKTHKQWAKLSHISRRWTLKLEVSITERLNSVSGLIRFNFFISTSAFTCSSCYGVSCIKNTETAVLCLICKKSKSQLSKNVNRICGERKHWRELSNIFSFFCDMGYVVLIFLFCS